MASIRFYLEKPYLPKTDKKLKSSKCSIYLMFTVDRHNRFPMTLDEKIEPKFWDFKNQKVKPTYRGHFEINNFLADQEYNLMKLYRENRSLPFDKFNSLAQAKPSEEKKTLFLAYEQFLKVSSEEKDVKTVAKFLTLQKHLIKFDLQYPFDFQTLDFNFYDRFKTYLYSIPNQFYLQHCLVNRGDYWELVKGDHGELVGIFDDQVFAYLIQLKTFLKWAEKRDYLVNNSYKSWQILKRKHDPIALTLSELEILENHIFQSTAEDTARDYLVLQCRTGQRISDIKRFNLKDFSDLKWTFAPKKGNRLSPKTVTVHFKGFCSPAVDILQKYNWKLPVISDQKLNENIKRACKSAGINSPVEYIRWAQNKRVIYKCPKYELISNHSGRRTFITLSLQVGLPVEYVMALTGITEYKTIRHYKGKFEDSAIEQALEKIPTSRSILKKAL